MNQYHARLQLVQKCRMQLKYTSSVTNWSLGLLRKFREISESMQSFQNILTTHKMVWKLLWRWDSSIGVALAHDHDISSRAPAMKLYSPNVIRSIEMQLLDWSSYPLKCKMCNGYVFTAKYILTCTLYVKVNSFLHSL